MDPLIHFVVPFTVMTLMGAKTEKALPVLNVLRVVAILLIAYEYGSQTALGVFHTFGGWVLFTIGIVVYLVLIEWLSKRPSLKIDPRRLIKPLLRPEKIKTALFIVLITILTQHSVGMYGRGR